MSYVLSFDFFFENLGFPWAEPHFCWISHSRQKDLPTSVLDLVAQVAELFTGRDHGCTSLLVRPPRPSR